MRKGVPEDMPEGAGEGVPRAMEMEGAVGEAGPRSALKRDEVVTGGMVPWSPLEADEMLLGEASDRSRARTYCGPRRGLPGCEVEISILGRGETDRAPNDTRGGWSGEGVRSAGGA